MSAFVPDRDCWLGVPQPDRSMKKDGSHGGTKTQRGSAATEGCWLFVRRISRPASPPPR